MVNKNTTTPTIDESEGEESSIGDMHIVMDNLRRQNQTQENNILHIQ